MEVLESNFFLNNYSSDYKEYIYKEVSYFDIDISCDKDEYIKFLIFFLLAEKDYIRKELLSNNEYRRYLMYFLIVENRDSDYLLIPKLNNDDLYSLYLNKYNFENNYDLDIYKSIFDNCDYFFNDLHPVLLPLYYIKVIEYIDGGEDIGHPYLKEFFNTDIWELMDRVGMEKLTSLDDYEYYIQNIKYYNSGDKGDRELMEENKALLYYKNRLDLKNKLTEDSIIFKSLNIKEGNNYSKEFKDKKHLISYGNGDNFFIFKLQNIIHTMSMNRGYLYKDIRGNFVELNNKEMCYFIKFLNHYFGKEDKHVILAKKQIRKSIDENNKKILKIDTSKDLNYYKNMLYDGLMMRGLDNNSEYPISNFGAKYRAYFDEKVSRYDLDYSYLYIDDNFVYNGKVNHKEINRFLLSSIYISTSIYYITTQYKKVVDNFEISTMI